MVYYIYNCMNTENSSMLSSDTNSSNYHSEENIVQKYTNALYRFYQLKSRYENDISTKKNAIKRATKSNKERRDMFRRFTPSCVSCGRKVGSVFSITSNTENTTHTAKCGDTQNPCQLDIKLKTDIPYDVRKQRASELEGLHTYGKNVIRLTNDGMFGYITGDAMVDTHDAYQEEQLANEQVQKKRDIVMKNRDYASNIETSFMSASLADNKGKQLDIYNKTELLNQHVAAIKTHMKDYARTGNKQFIRDSIQLYANEMRTNIDNLNKDKYARMAVERRDKPTIYTLFQEPSTLSSWLLDDHEPKIESFTIGKKLKNPEENKEEEETEFVPPSIPNIASAVTALLPEMPAILSDTQSDQADIDLSPMDTTVLVEDADESDAESDVSEAVSDVSDTGSNDGDTLPRIHIGDTVDTSSDDAPVPPPPPISDMELSSSDEGFVPPPPPIDEMGDSNSEGNDLVQLPLSKEKIEETSEN